MNKKLFFQGIFLVILSISVASAITASIGNSRMVLYSNPGESVEKYILVKNVNDVDVTIELIPTGDLQDYITVKENNFTISAGDEKNAYFTIESPVAGQSESKMVVKFSAENESSVGLSSTIIIFAGNSSEKINITDIRADKSGFSLSSLINLVKSDSKPSSEESNSSNTTKKSDTIDKKPISISPLLLMTMSTSILLVILIILLIISTKPKKRSTMK